MFRFIFLFIFVCFVNNLFPIESHPRLLLKRDEENRIKMMIIEHEQMKTVHDYIIKYSDKTIGESPVNRIKQGKRLLAVSRIALQRIYFLSYSYRMTKNIKYAERAKQELLAVCNFQDWNPSHYLDVGEMAMAVAIGYDWLYDYLSENVKMKLRKAIVEKAFNTAEIGGFYDRTNNWNQVCNAGLVLAALAIYEEEKEKSDYIIDKAVKTVPLAMESYSPDGIYPEGFSYWGYGTGFQVTMLAAMESALGTDFGLSDNYGFLKSPYFMLYMTAPSGWCYNFCDSGRKIDLNQAMYWFASKNKDTSLLWYECYYLKRLNKYTGNDIDRLLPNILIFSKDIDLANLKEPKGKFFSGKGIKPVFIYRSGWSNKTDSYLGVVAGSPSIPHGHMDSGSFVYEKKGERWAIDLGLQSYYTLEKEGVDLWNSSQNGQRWDVFRLGNTGHTTITINGKKHLVTGNPEFIETYQKSDYKGAKIDMTSLYGDDVENVLRSVYLDKNDDLNIIDEIQTNGNNAEIMWTMVTSAQAKIIKDNIIELSKNGKKMRFHVEAPIDINLKIWENKPVHHYDQDNPGTVRVGFTADLSPNDIFKFKVTVKE